MESEEVMKYVPKVWGKEVWIVNCDKYCGKLLYLKAGAICSVHMHPIKQETFYTLDGQVALTVEGREHTLSTSSGPQTIHPGQKHFFRGITDATILEISTHHSEEDVVRYTSSQPKQ